jgi:hypothetical protein
MASIFWGSGGTMVVCAAAAPAVMHVMMIIFTADFDIHAPNLTLAECNPDL